jgi:anti-sigma regulatory factor (Ser/Thr protein kinase)
MKGKRFQFTPTLSRLDELMAQLSDLACTLQPDLTEAWLAELRLICTEIYSNICAYSGLTADDRIWVVIYQEKNLFKLWFRDRGARWYPEKAPVPDLEEPLEHGYGLYLIRTLTDCFIYKRKEQRPYCNVTQIAKRIQHA